MPGGVFLNDLVVTERAVWVTDSRVDRLTRIALNRRGLPRDTPPTFVPLTGEWPAFNGSTAANGIRELPDGSLVLNNSTAGGLWRVNPRTGVTREIEVRGGPGLVGGDGLVLRDRTLYNVRGSGPNQVSVLRLSRRHGRWVATWRVALFDETLDVPSTATFAAGSLWVVNARFGVALARHRLLLGHPAPGRLAPAGAATGRAGGATPPARWSGRAEDARRAARRTRLRSVRPRRRGCCDRC